MGVDGGLVVGQNGEWEARRGERATSNSMPSFSINNPLIKNIDVRTFNKHPHNAEEMGMENGLARLTSLCVFNISQ